MAAVTSYESWVGSEVSIGTEQLGSIWDLVRLGKDFVPGVCTIQDFKIGQDVDIQKAKGKEKAKLRDNGMALCGFNIKVELTAAQWPAWLKFLRTVQPKPGAVRVPLNIEHPLPNSNGVSAVYIREIEYGEPSARKGMMITIRVAEWAPIAEDKELVAKGPGSPLNPKQPAYSPPNYFGDSRRLAETLRNNQGMPAEDSATVLDRIFNGDGG